MTKHILRNSALDVLIRIGDNGAFSHLIIDQTIKKNQLSMKDQALFTEIVYGTLQRKLTLAYFTKRFVAKPNKLEDWVKWLLYMSFYQMQYLDKVPDHAIIHEAVSIAKKRGHLGIAKLVNGVLRNAQRNGFPNIEEIEDEAERISIATSHPLWLVKRWINTYGFEKTVEICEANVTTKPISIRINLLRITREEAIDQLLEEGYESTPSLFSEQGIIVQKGNILKSKLFAENLVTIQDQSSMLVAEMMNLTEDLIVLDACSAPGGKATHIAEKLRNSGQVIAYDLHEKKANLVTQKAKALGLTNVVAKGMDARKLSAEHPEDFFDRILIDAPCSGLGVIRGKPDIKYSKKESDIHTLAKIQLELLDNISPLLKKNGTLLYSTCTVDRAENEGVISTFLTSHPDFEIDPNFIDELPTLLKESPGLTDLGLQIFPDDFQTDGFFLTRLRKKR
ncbi:16S rRNA (cytosine967-C5)-methyltransferase [Natronobacillus azotifigens]|uniref:16S rRNA (cytosine(967)-C(5))-methyltransferase n=1 Tax=Natronobacillus azotifigens TaxID=472978 RepID=A0A9J6RDF3_9BACI|nr:16S rRNA (cytosine(967)-C(5))-methyltransferase RsmB [Natronobacillus azotifigens]MCZ0703379.1 16S rRNA (cytosine(967)-C(5))-methyltransferase RsmB [Natronobacillus azotifigens]